MRVAGAGSGPNKPVTPQRFSILTTTKLCRERQIDGAGLEFVLQNEGIFADEHNAYVWKRLTEAPQDRRGVAPNDVVGNAEPDLAFKRGLPERGDQLLVCRQEMLDGRQQPLPLRSRRNPAATRKNRG